MKKLATTLSIKKIYKIMGIMVLSISPLYIFANVEVGGIVTQTEITTRYIEQCTSNFDYALYEGQSLISANIHTPTTLESSREYFPQINVKIYNPFEAFGDKIVENSLGGLLPTFIYKSNGRPGTSHFGGEGIKSTYIYKQNSSTYAITENPNPIRDDVAAQIVHNFYRKQILGWGGQSFTMTYLPYEGTLASVEANPKVWHDMLSNVKCQNFYIAKCGDGVIDDPNKDGDENIDGKNGILISGSIIDWRKTGFTGEVCDDGELNGTDGYCNEFCTGQYTGSVGEQRCGDSILQPALTFYSNGEMSFETCDNGDVEDPDNPGIAIGEDLSFCTLDCQTPFEEEFIEVFIEA